MKRAAVCSPSAPGRDRCTPPADATRLVVLRRVPSLVEPAYAAAAVGCAFVASTSISISTFSATSTPPDSST